MGDEQQWPLTAVSTHALSPEPDAVIELQEQGHEQALLNAIGEQKEVPVHSPILERILCRVCRLHLTVLSGLQWASQATCLQPHCRVLLHSLLRSWQLWLKPLLAIVCCLV